ncbi:histidine phosphatase family protein [Nakamurella antarctica]|uniref:Histidine phosphatase family protein n=1 Tax=Nakamurella antarctica TaxID=1902245 RepID=A0A3G8ZSN2_9ACTN|nr:histidine phosphatase family protein [Nakamurella antarctica]AZI57504.1 histidine phosphatase family protein [Nakamurella antarctica]
MSNSRIALIRHGQTEWSQSGRHTSVTDIDLTAFGEEQATRIPWVLQRLGIAPTTVLVSPRLRAQRTAALAGLAVTQTDDELVEFGYGDYEGLTTPQIRELNPAWSVFRDGGAGPTGESPAQAQARADRVLGRARAAMANGDVALVCHGHISRVLAVRWIELAVQAAQGIALDPAAITVLGDHNGFRIIEHANVPDLTHVV